MCFAIVLPTAAFISLYIFRLTIFSSTLPYFKHVDRYEYQRRHSYRPYPLSAVRDITRQVFEALAFMHTLELVHTDIKPENICLVKRDSERES